MKNQPRKNNMTLVACSALCVFSLMLSACGKKEQAQQPQPAPNQVKSVAANQSTAPVQKAMSSSTIKPTSPVSPSSMFDFSNRKDPFKPGLIVKNVAEVPVENKKNVVSALPIHSFDVSQFKLIGIITGGKENQAMVVDPNGKGYVIKNGMTIGKNEGKIAAITTSGVEVIEQFKDDNGKLRKENIRLTLPRKQ